MAASDHNRIYTSLTDATKSNASNSLGVIRMQKPVIHAPFTLASALYTPYNPA